jgi:hypothetical protein
MVFGVLQIQVAIVTQAEGLDYFGRQAEGQRLALCKKNLSVSKGELTQGGLTLITPPEGRQGTSLQPNRTVRRNANEEEHCGLLPKNQTWHSQ